MVQGHKDWKEKKMPKRKSPTKRSPAQKRAFARFQGKGTVVAFGNRVEAMLKGAGDILITDWEREQLSGMHFRLKVLETRWDNNSDRLLNKAREKKGE